MRVQALLLAATLALQGSVAQPAHRHAHLHKRSLQEVVEKRAPADAVDYDAAIAKLGLSQDDWDRILKGQDLSGNFAEDAPKSEVSEAPKVQQKNEVSSANSDADKKKTNVEEKKKAPVEKPSSNGSAGKKDEDTEEHDTSSTGDCSDLSDLHFSGKGNAKRAAPHQDGYMGNAGGAKYASNMIPEKSCKSNGKYSLTFVNKGESSDFWIWNKVGSDGQPQSGMMGMGSQEFHLKKGQSACFTMQSNTQMGFSKAMGRATTRGNVPNGNVGEANFDDQSEDGEGSLYNVSMVTYNEIKNPIDGKPPGNPVLVPMSISAQGKDASTPDHCVYTENGQNSPIKPWKSGESCNTYAPKGQPFHVTATFE